MGYLTALSGLSAASNSLSVTGNNIANANTSGFKKSRTEFADMYSGTLLGASKTQPGSGVALSQVAQQFNQGNIDTTENVLDLAIGGEGFFTLAQDPTHLSNISYTRNGAFKVNSDGAVVNNTGNALMVTDVGGSTLRPLFLPARGLPTATSSMSLDINLDYNQTPITNTFDPLNAKTYNNRNDSIIYDSLGGQHKMTTYFTRTSASEWTAHHYITDDPYTPTPMGTSDGTPTKVIPVPTIPFTVGPWSPPNGSDPISITMDYSGSTSFAAPFSVAKINQNGYAAGELTGINIDGNGLVNAKFSNGATVPQAQIALTRFINPQGLAKIGDTNWQASLDSGLPVTGNPGTGRFGNIKSSALELSNVDLSNQLTNLIIAQQAYQANAQTISTETSIMQTLLQKL